MIPDFARNGFIREEIYAVEERPSYGFLYFVIDVTRLPQYRDQIINPVNRLYEQPSQEISRDGLVGIKYKDDYSGITRIEKCDIQSKISKEFGLWRLPFTPEKYKDGTQYDEIDTLEVLLTTFEWRRRGEIYVPDGIEFDGTPDDWKKVTEFYRGFPNH